MRVADPNNPGNCFEMHSNWPVGAFWVTRQPWNPSLKLEGWNALIGVSEVTCSVLCLPRAMGSPGGNYELLGSSERRKQTTHGWQKTLTEAVLTRARLLFVMMRWESESRRSVCRLTEQVNISAMSQGMISRHTWLNRVSPTALAYKGLGLGDWFFRIIWEVWKQYLAGWPVTGLESLSWDS